MKLENEIKAFLSCCDDTPCCGISKETQKEIQSELRWFSFFVFSKILALHVVVGFLTLLICPQFGISPLGKETWLSEVFMSYGPWVCAFLCGGLFLSSSTLAMLFALKPGEVQYLNQHRFGILSGLALGSLVLFFLINKSLPEMHAMLSLETALVWLGSGLLFAFLALFLGMRWQQARP